MIHSRTQDQFTQHTLQLLRSPFPASFVKHTLPI